MALKPSRQVVLAWIIGVVALAFPWFGVIEEGLTSDTAYHCALNTALVPVVGLLVIAAMQGVALLVARLLGDRALWILLGVGPQVAKFQIRNCTITVFALPVIAANYTISTNAKSHADRLFVAHGVVPLLAVCVVFWSLLMSSGKLQHDFTSRVDVENLVFGVALIAGVFAMISFPAVTDEALADRRASAFSLESLELARRGAFDEALQAVQQGLAKAPKHLGARFAQALCFSLKEDDRAFDSWLVLVHRELPEQQHCICLAMWAWECVIRGTDDLRDSADHASKEAFERAPDNPATTSVRAHVLLWHRRYDDAEELFRRCYADGTTPGGRRDAASGMAILCNARDRHDEAIEWLAKARSQSGTSRMLARAIATVEPLAR